MTQTPSADSRTLHFTLGPVQGFVAQARRTRDLWAGSFLLSWLAGHAMAAVVEADRNIVLPDISKDPLIAAIRTRPGGFGPAVGSLPNRFKARVPAGFDPDACRNAIDHAWRGLADRVWQRFVAPVAGMGRDTETIWDRQVSGFWDVAWVVADDPGDGSDGTWLDRRKNWRTWRPPVEGGDHCTLMGDWQELSGFIRARERPEQDAFWSAMRERLPNPLDLDEQGRERLCAMALIKRLFLEVAEDAIGWTPSWDKQALLHWPSTPRLAATGWVARAWRDARREAEAFVKVAKGTKRAEIEPPLAEDDRLSRVAGQLLHRSGIESARDEELAPVKRSHLLNAHKALTKAVGCEPSAFYALLLMDGDSVGKLLRKYDERAIAAALAGFACGVEQKVRSAGGYLVYAGGDDVLALMPLEGALATARALRDAYIKAFNEQSIPEATTSAALAFVHFHVPLREALSEAHRQLDDVAKAGNGRDSLAVAVLSQSGVLGHWVSAWEPKEGKEPKEARKPPPALMDEMADQVSNEVAGRFFYKVRQTWGGILSSSEGGEAGEGLFTLDQLRQILVAEILAGDNADEAKLTSVGSFIDDVLILARRWRGDRQSSNRIDMDGPLIARFLRKERR